MSELRPDLAEVARFVPDGSRVLDLGCGRGELMRHLMDRRGCACTRVEVDPNTMLSAVDQGVTLT